MVAIIRNETPSRRDKLFLLDVGGAIRVFYQFIIVFRGFIDRIEYETF